MRYILAATVAALIATPAVADTMAHCGAAWKAMSAADQAKYGTDGYKTYSKTCLAKGYTVPTNGDAMSAAPAMSVPTGATATCKDGTYSMSKTAKGRCSGHGGVDKTM